MAASTCDRMNLTCRPSLTRGRVPFRPHSRTVEPNSSATSAAVISSARVSPRAAPGEIDLDPDVLYGTEEPMDDRPLERRIVETAR